VNKQIQSLGQRISQLEAENTGLKAINQLLLYEKKQWDESKERQTQIIQSTVDDVNSKTSFLSEEVQRLHIENVKLRKENKELKEKCRSQ